MGLKNRSWRNVLKRNGMTTTTVKMHLTVLVNCLWQSTTVTSGVFNKGIVNVRTPTFTKINYFKCARLHTRGCEILFTIS